MERMHAALVSGARVVALISPEYLRSDHCQAEWQNAIADDPLNTQSRLIVLRVVECEPVGLLRGLAYWDLVPVRDNRALLEQIVLEAVREDRRTAAPSGPYWRTPRTIIDADAVRPVPSFSGREAELSAISAALANDGSIVALGGLGGVGKSSIAREYAWRNRDSYSVVWWLNAQTEDGIIEGLLRLGALFTRGLDQIKDRRAAAQQVTGSMLSGFAKPVLLVFDNLEDERLLRAWQPRTGSRILITSRDASWGSGVTTVAMETWLPETAAEYLRRESGRADLSEADARAIAQTLGGLPLALSHAAASLRQMRMVAPQRYLERIGERLKNAPRGVEYPGSVFATFGAAIAQAEQQAPGAAAALCFAASFAPDAIPDELFRQPLALCPGGLQPVVSGEEAFDLHSALADDLRFDEALGALDRLSLLTFAQSSRTYSLHRLVQLAAKDLTAGAALAWREYAVDVANSSFPEVEFTTWAQCERLLPHARTVVNALPGDTSSLSAAGLAHRCAVYLRERGEYGASELLCTRAVAIRDDALGSDHPDLASSLNLLATLHHNQGRYEKADPLYARSLAIRERALGPDDSLVAFTLNNLAASYRDQGRYAEAEPLHTRALSIWEKGLGPDHPDVAYSLNNLGILYHDQGRYAEAEPLHTRALAIWEQALGPDHPRVAVSLNNLALVYDDQGRYPEAEQLQARALAIREKALGPDHPDIALSLNNLANVYAHDGRHAEAEQLFKRALTIWEPALGDHPNVAEILSNLADVYDNQGRHAEAEALCTRALAIFEKALGPDHPHVARTLNSLASVYSHEGRGAEAEPLLTQALAIREKALGADHPLTKAAREALDALR